ncbi:MAG TPA: hypothetical protein VGR73_15440 [Bryobacteraceae bacterium]|nr:hypothetical protein [Bryobacteraceae bacterium]
MRLLPHVAPARGLFIVPLFALPLFAVDGIVLNGTLKRPQPGIEITLVQPGQKGMQQLGKTVSDAQGKFNIDKVIPPGPGLLQSTYQGATYNQIVTPGMPTSGVEVMVYESTNKAGTAKATQHLIIMEPSAEQIRVSELFIIDNKTAMTYHDPAAGSAQFFLPPGAADSAKAIITAPGGMPIPRPPTKTAKAGIYKVDYPLKPGETRIEVTYAAPAAQKFSGKITPSDAPTRLITPSTVTLTGDGIESLGQEPQTQAHLYNLSGLDYNVLIDGTGAMNLAPSNGEASEDEDNGAPKVVVASARIYSRLGWVLGLAFGILALGGVALYRRGAA